MSDLDWLRLKLGLAVFMGAVITFAIWIGC